MKKRPTRNDVARIAGVAGSTVHYALSNNNSWPMSEETRRRVLEAAEELGYTPNRVAKALKTGKCKAVGIITHDINIPFEQMFIGRLQKLIHKSQYDTLIDSVLDIENSDDFYNAVTQWPVDGLISFWPTAKSLEQAKRSRMPVVALSHSHVDTDSVRYDLYDGSVSAVEHLIQVGCSSVGLAIPSRALETDKRAFAYKDVIKKHNLRENFFFYEYANRDIVYQQILETFKKTTPPDGLFCYSDDCAIAVQRALLDLGYKIPEQVAIVGVDGILETKYSNPRLSTVENPFEEMCEALWELLENRLKQPDLPYRTLNFSPKLVIRESSLR
jgi:DNA-binding LacI/PurR family transcriptional regulator